MAERGSAPNERKEKRQVPEKHDGQVKDALHPKTRESTIYNLAGTVCSKIVKSVTCAVSAVSRRA